MKSYSKSITIGTGRYSVESDDAYLSGVPDDFDPDLCRIFRRLIESTDVVADIGANLGLTAILFPNSPPEPMPLSHRRRRSTSLSATLQETRYQTLRSLTLRLAMNMQTPRFDSTHLIELGRSSVRIDSTANMFQKRFRWFHLMISLLTSMSIRPF